MPVFNQTYPRSAAPFSDKELHRAAGGRSALYHYLKRFSTRDVVYWHDDFSAKAIDTTNDWTVAAGATATTWARTAGANGFIRGVLGTTAATSGLQINLDLADFFGDQNVGMEFRWRTSGITEMRFEGGFANALPAVNTTVVNNLATPTFNTTAGGAMYVYNETGGTTTSGLYHIGSDVSAAKFATTTNRPVNATWQTVRIQLIGDYAHMWVDEAPVAVSMTASQQLQGGDSLKAFVSLKANSASSRNIDIDYITIWQDRL